MVPPCRRAGLAVGRYSWLRHNQVVGRERPACARVGKEKRETHVNLGIRSAI
ncbi:hypothetical protein J3F83DRAFT_723165, partial [Trichoderma novae-zelandiae]